MLHFVDHTWQRILGDRRAADGTPDEASLWRFRRPTGAAIERPRPPSRRMASCHMPRTTFLVVAFGWTLAVSALLAAVLAVRWRG
jgi:hypothetical protein